MAKSLDSSLPSTITMVRLKRSRLPFVDLSSSSSELSPPRKKTRHETRQEQNTLSDTSNPRYYNPQQPVASSPSSSSSATRPFVNQSRAEPPSCTSNIFSGLVAPLSSQLNVSQAISELHDNEERIVEDDKRGRLGEQLRKEFTASTRFKEQMNNQLDFQRDAVEEKENILPSTPSNARVFRFGMSTNQVGAEFNNTTSMDSISSSPRHHAGAAPISISVNPVSTPHVPSYKKTWTPTSLPSRSADADAFMKTYIPLKSTVIDGITYSVGEYINIENHTDSDIEIVKIHAIGKDRTPRNQQVHLSVYGMYPSEILTQLLEDEGVDVDDETFNTLNSLGKTELVLTDCHFVIPVENLIGHINLEIFRDNICDHQPFSNTVSFNRFSISFSGSPARLHPTDCPEETCSQCPQCDLIYDPTETVQRFCDRCKLWFHEQCLEQYSTSQGMKQTGSGVHYVQVVSQYPIIRGLARCPPLWGTVGNGRLMRMIRAWDSAPEDRPKFWALALGKVLDPSGDKTRCIKIGREFMDFMLTSKRNGLLLAMKCPSCARRI